MKTPKWICNICKKTLTRKWNAKRHCNTQHDGIYDSIVLFSEYLITSFTPKMTANFFNQEVSSSELTKLPYPQNPQNLPLKDQSTLSRIDSNMSFQPINTDDDTLNRELLFSKIMDRIAPKYEEISNLLSYLPEAAKTQIRGIIIYNTFYADDPIKFINKILKNLRKSTSHNRILDDASSFFNINKQACKEFLKMGLKEDMRIDF